MRKAGNVVAEMHARIRDAIRPGVTTAELDKIGREVIDLRGARSNFLNYHGFPAVICASPNDVIVHGIPGDYRLEDGDIISIDCGAIIEGYHGDSAWTHPVGEVTPEAAIRRRLALYEDQTEPLIAWYLAKDKLITIDGLGQPDEVTRRLIRAIDARRGRHA